MVKTKSLSGLAQPTLDEICQHIDKLVSSNLFSGKAAVTPTQAGALIQLAEQTVRNKLVNGTYPFPVVEIGGRRLVLTQDIIAVLAGVPAVSTRSSQKQPRRPGRPLKVVKAKKVGAR